MHSGCGAITWQIEDSIEQLKHIAGRLEISRALWNAQAATADVWSIILTSSNEARIHRWKTVNFMLSQKQTLIFVRLTTSYFMVRDCIECNQKKNNSDQMMIKYFHDDPTVGNDHQLS